MSYPEPKFVSMIAQDDLSSYQYKFVKVGSTSDKHVQAQTSANGKTIGVLMNAPTAGQAAEVCIEGGALLKVSETVAALNLLTPTTAALGEVADAADEWVGAMALEGGVANDVVPVLVKHFYASKSDA